ncbi:pyridoxal-phosphate dependent enzyme [Streptomyces monashensis]|uniref:pyridoxal-phosphate dependent enzyme n=1 Tax=Streptomyces monashensis TaxID=1678012 RepID=UPI0033FFF439
MEVFRQDTSVVLRYAEHVDGVEEAALRRVSQREGARIVRLPPFAGVELDVLDLSTLAHTGTFKDWVACVATARALQARTPIVAAQSSGNTANALASYVSHAGIRSVVLYPPDSRRRIHPHLAAHPLVDFVEVDAGEHRIKQILREVAQAAGVPALPSLTDQYEGNKLRAHLLCDAAKELGHDWDWHVQALSSAYGPLGFYRGVDELGCGPGPRLLGVQQEAVAPYAEALGGVGTDPTARILEPTLFRRLLTDDLVREVRRLCANTAGTVRMLSNRRYLDSQWRAVQLLEDAGVHVTLSPDGEPRERAGLYALCGALAAIEDGLVSRGERILVVHTGGSGPACDLFDPEHTAAEQDAVALITSLLARPVNGHSVAAAQRP